MDVFPELLSDKECSYFKPTDYIALKDILNDVLAQDIKDYMNNPAANPAVVADMQKYLAPTIESLTLHFVLEERGITDLVRSLVPENLLQSQQDLDDVISKLKFLEDNESKLLTAIPARTKTAWNNFHSAMVDVNAAIISSGDEPTYSDWISRIEANSFVFYTPREQATDTGNKLFSLRKRHWSTVLRGAQYIQRCNAEGIAYHERRRF